MDYSNYKIWVDGQLVPWNSATVHITAHSLHYGSNVFEGMRAYSTPRGPAVLGMEPHMRRFFRSAKILNIRLDYTETQIAAAIVDTLRANELKAAYIRPIAFRGAGILSIDGLANPVHVSVIALGFRDYLGKDAIENGIDVSVSSWRRLAPDTQPVLAKIGGNYVNSQFVKMEARRQGFEESICLDISGQVSEGSSENVFLVMDGVILTPPVSSSIVAGITRYFVLQLAADRGYEVREQTIPRELLYVADELFLTGTAAEIVPVKSVDGYSIGDGRRGPITATIQQDFFEIVSGATEDRHGWLHYVDQAN